MDIVTLDFEEPFVINVSGQSIKIITFKTLEHGNVKFGVDAPRNINVHREEIFHAIKEKAKERSTVQ